MYYGTHGPFKRAEGGQAITFENDKVHFHCENYQVSYFPLQNFNYKGFEVWSSWSSTAVPCWESCENCVSAFDQNLCLSFRSELSEQCRAMPCYATPIRSSISSVCNNMHLVKHLVTAIPTPSSLLLPAKSINLSKILISLQFLFIIKHAF